MTIKWWYRLENNIPTSASQVFLPGFFAKPSCFSLKSCTPFFSLFYYQIMLVSSLAVDFLQLFDFMMLEERILVLLFIFSFLILFFSTPTALWNWVSLSSLLRALIGYQVVKNQPAKRKLFDETLVGVPLPNQRSRHEEKIGESEVELIDEQMTTIETPCNSEGEKTYECWKTILLFSHSQDNQCFLTKSLITQV